MPKIQWTNLPLALRQHLFDRLEERKITAEDLYQLKLWRESEPEASDGLWFKDFGTFKICVKANSPRRSFSKGSQQRAKRYSRPFTCKRRLRRYARGGHLIPGLPENFHFLRGA